MFKTYEWCLEINDIKTSDYLLNKILPDIFTLDLKYAFVTGNM